MALHRVTYTEITPVTFMVEADSAEDAQQQINRWLIDNDHAEQVADLMETGDAHPMFMFDTSFETDFDLTATEAE